MKSPSSLEPLVSVCIPIYNAEPYLAETLHSVLAQTYTHWELILVENQSKDSSRATIERFAKEADDPRIKIHYNEVHLDMAGNMNRAMALAQGEFIKLLCADDTLEPTCLATQMASLQEHPSAVLSACGRRIINAEGKLFFERKTFRKDGLISSRDAMQACFRAGTNLIGEPTMVLLRASSIKGIDWMDPKMAYCVDVDFWLRLLLRGDMVYTRQPLASFRVHGQASTRKLERQAMDDFLRMAETISAKANAPLSRSRLRLMKIKILLQNAARRWIYRWLENR